MKLPFILIVENNQYAYSTPITKQFAAQHLSDRALGYGIPGVTVDGTNVAEVYEACVEAVARARKGDGPSLIESITMRMDGHSASDDASYVPKELLEQWQKRDPIDRFEKSLVEERLLTEQGRRQVEERVSVVIEDAIQFAINSPYPAAADAAGGVFAP